MKVLSASDAAAAVATSVAAQPPLRMPLQDAQGHVLAADLVAPLDLPPWTNASMDGYAVRADDVQGARSDRPVRLRVTAEVAAGDAAGAVVAAGTAVRIFTGAPLPPGADSVVRQEDVRRDGNAIDVLDDRDAGGNVRRVGSDVSRGDVVLAAGTFVGPHEMALLAALAVAHPMVHRQPRVGIIASGDELVSLEHPEEILSGRRLADANTPALVALVRRAGGIAVPLGIARDDPDDLLRRVQAAEDIDLLITAGGVSVGDHDHIRAVMASCGVRMIFDRVRLRPGGPTAFGLFPDARPWLALPGNPVSALVTFELFGRAAIRAMAGHHDPFRRRIVARLADDVRRDATLEQFVRVTLASPDAGALPAAALTGPQGSGMMMPLVRADGLAIIPAGVGVQPAGSTVTALRFDDR